MPLREALPSPFGLRLSTTRIAAALIFTTQLLCLVIPALLLTGIFFDSANDWLKPGDPAWRDGLIVTKWGSDELVDRWSWPEKNTRYWLKEYRGLPGDPLARQITSFNSAGGIIDKVAIVPEPGACLLTGIGAVFVGLRRKARNNGNQI